MVYKTYPRPCKICGKIMAGGMGVASHMRVHRKKVIWNEHERNRVSNVQNLQMQVRMAYRKHAVRRHWNNRNLPRVHRGKRPRLLRWIHARWKRLFFESRGEKVWKKEVNKMTCKYCKQSNHETNRCPFKKCRLCGRTGAWKWSTYPCAKLCGRSCSLACE